MIGLGLKMIKWGIIILAIGLAIAICIALPFLLLVAIPLVVCLVVRKHVMIV